MKDIKMSIKTALPFVLLRIYLFSAGVAMQTRNLGNFQEVFAWKQLTYNLDGHLALQDRFADDVSGSRSKRGSGVVFRENQQEDVKPWSYERPSDQNVNGGDDSPAVRPADDEGRLFIQYNNVPMGVEVAGDRIFITVPRRRYGIPSTLNYVDVKTDSNTRSPPLRPYPDLPRSRELTSVYRTRADRCGRLWMVDTGLLEIPGAPRQVQAPAIVIYDLNSDQQILRYQFKDSDIPAANTPTGLASITVDITGDCADAHAYVPDLTTYGLIVFSLREGDSWRLTHNYFYLSPTAGDFRVAEQRFQWSDGIFSLTLTEADAGGCRAAYFHPLSSYEEFSVSTCVLKDRNASSDSDFWTKFSKVGYRGDGSQSTMHGYHSGSSVVFFAEVGRDAVSCWNSGQMLTPGNVAILAQDRRRMSYPSDLHVTGDEVWVMANTLPRFGYSTLDTSEYNFYVYRGYVRNLIAGTVCDSAIYRHNG